MALLIALYLEYCHNQLWYLISCGGKANKKATIDSRDEVQPLMYWHVCSTCIILLKDGS